MKKSILTASALLLIAVTSCSRKEDIYGDFTGIAVDALPEESPVSVGFDITGTEFIPLEATDDVLLGYIDRLVANKDGLFILSGHRVYRFDNSGKFLNLVGAAGSGPGEYMSANAFWVDRDSVYVVDGNMEQVHAYSTDGSWGRDISGMGALRFASDIVTRGKSVALIGNNISFEDDTPLYMEWSPAEASSTECIVKTGLSSRGSMAFCRRMMTGEDGNFYMLQPLSGKILRLSAATDTVSTAIILNGIGLEGIDREGDYTECFSKALKSNANPPLGIFTVGKFVILNLLRNNVIWNRETAKGVTMSNQVPEGSDGVFPFVPQMLCFSDGEQLLGVFDATSFMAIAGKDPSITVPPSVSEDSNPVIVRYLISGND